MNAHFGELSTLELHALAEQLWDDIQSLPLTEGHEEDEQRELWRRYNEVEAEIDRRTQSKEYRGNEAM